MHPAIEELQEILSNDSASARLMDFYAWRQKWYDECHVIATVDDVNIPPEHLTEITRHHRECADRTLANSLVKEPGVISEQVHGYDWDMFSQKYRATGYVKTIAVLRAVPKEK